MQVTSLLPEFSVTVAEHVTSTTVPGFTGNCVVVFSVLIQSVLSPVQSDSAIIPISIKITCKYMQ